MKHLLPILAVFVVGAVTTIAIHGCTKQQGLALMDASKIVCCVAQKTTDEEAIKQACGIADELTPFVHELVAAKAASIADGGPE